jgi:hypothetical protein
VLNCRTVTRLFVDFFDEGLPVECRELIEEHLTACPLCAASADSYEAVIRLARQLPPAPVPLELIDNLRSAARAIGLPIPEPGDPC